MSLIPTLHHQKRHCARCGRLKHSDCFECADATVCTACHIPERQRQRQLVAAEKAEAALHARRVQKEQADALRGVGNRPDKVAIGA